MGVTLWQSYWSHLPASQQLHHPSLLLIFSLLTLATAVLSVLRAEASFRCLIYASRRLHDRMLTRLLRAPCLFFDSNPVGRILNRYLVLAPFSRHVIFCCMVI